MKKTFSTVFPKIKIKYISYRIPKKNWFRKIDSPSDELKEFQYVLKRFLENRLLLEQWVVWWRKGFSVCSWAKKHVNQKLLINTDIRNFYETISDTLIKKKLSPYFDNIDGVIKFLTYNGRLPQWAPSSTIIANYVFQEVDKKIIKLINKYLQENFKKQINFQYSRYIDDISISFNIYIKKEHILTILYRTIRSFWFVLNKEKTYIFPDTHKMVCTGLVVNKKVSFPRYSYRKLRSKIFHYLKNWSWYFPYIKWLLMYLKHVDNEKYIGVQNTYARKFWGNKDYHELFNICNDFCYNLPDDWSENKKDSIDKISKKSLLKKSPKVILVKRQKKDGEDYYEECLYKKSRMCSHNTSSSSWSPRDDSPYSSYDWDELANMFPDYLDMECWWKEDQMEYEYYESNLKEEYENNCNHLKNLDSIAQNSIGMT